jgi:tripartite-type tricarboxylate transporter receptor subunit TctC
MTSYIKKLTLILLVCLPSVSYASNVTKILIGFPPGGGNYSMARALSESAARLGYPNIVESRPGAGGILGVNECVARAKEKNLICLVSQTQYAQSLLLSSDIRKFDPEKLTYIKIIAATPLVLVTNSNNHKSMQNLVADLKEPNGPPVFFGSSSIGLQTSTNWLFHQTKSVNGQNIDYKGINQIINDLLGNHINYSICFYSSVKAQIEQGNLRVVAMVGSTFDNPRLMNFARLQKTVPDMEVTDQKFGIVMGPDADPAAVKYYETMLTKIMHDPKFQEQIKAEGNFLYDANLSSSDFARIAAQERITLIKQVYKTK